MQHDVFDRWQWNLDIERGYTVRDAYQILTTQNSPLVDVMGDLI
jgi:hypothetical protein